MDQPKQNAAAPLEIRPYQLVQMVARIGAGLGPDLGDPKLTEVLRRVREDPLVPITLRCNVDAIYRYQNPGRADDTPEGELYNERRDLTILQRLGMVPGDTRPAISLFEAVWERIETAESVLGTPRPGSRTWSGSPEAVDGNYEKGRAMGMGMVIPRRPTDEMARVKQQTAGATLHADRLDLRPHHALCMSCFYGRRALAGKPLEPIAADNLYEAIVLIQRRPDVPLRLVRGCCMICPPCALYDPQTTLCNGGVSMSLRDQKKDLDVLYRLDLAYGDTLPAREYFGRLYEQIASTVEICGNGMGVVTAPEWAVCGGPEGDPGYVKAREDKLGIPGL